MSHPDSLLFITSSCLGDAVLTTGVLSHFVDTYPGIEVTVACGAVPAPLFEAVPHLKDCFVIHRQSFARHWFKLWQKVHRKRWTRIVDLRGTALSFVLKCTSKERLVWHSSGQTGHQVERVGRILGLTHPPGPRLWTHPVHEEEAGRVLAGHYPVIAIAPASNWMPKTWPLQHWVELIRDLVRPEGPFPKAAVFLMGAFHERPVLDALMEALPQVSWISSAGQMPLLTLYACLKRASLFIGNDSGLMHLAAASGVPTVGLFGPTNPLQYGPWGEKTVVVEAPGGRELLFQLGKNKPLETTMAGLMPAVVLEKIARLLDGSTVPLLSKPAVGG